MPSPARGLWTQAPSHTRSMSFVLSYVHVIICRFLLITEVAGAQERNGPDLKGSQPREHPRNDPTQTHGKCTEDVIGAEEYVTVESVRGHL